NRAVVWVDAETYRQRKPIAVAVYADESGGKPVGLETKGQQRQKVPAVVLEFTTPGLTWARDKEYKQSLADSDLYKKAVAARGQPLPPARPARKPAVEPVQFVRPGTPFNVLQPDPGVPKTPVGPGDPRPKQPAGTGDTVTPIPISETRTIWISPRTNRPFSFVPVKTDKETAILITGGIKLLAKFSTGRISSLEIEADNALVWRTGGDSTKTVNDMFSQEGARGAEGTELYLTGNVVIRYGAPKDVNTRGVQTQSRTLRADRVYYDVTNHKAIAVAADLEYLREGYVNTGHVVAEEIQQLSTTEFTAIMSRIHASRLPSDPGLVLNVGRAEVYQEPRQARRGLFGPLRNRLTGEIVEEEPEILEASDMSVEVLGTPVWYWPFLRTDVNDPFGPYRGTTFRQDRQFGFQTYTTWDMLKIVGWTPLNRSEHWTLLTDYLTRRGPGLGTNYSVAADHFMGMDAPYQTLAKGYMIYDQASDILGGPREQDFQPPGLRGRLLLRHIQDFHIGDADDLTVHGQFAYLSDRNFLEQYYKFERDYGLNQEAFLWVKYQTGNTAVTGLVQPDLGRYWESQTFWLPRVDGYLLGQSLLDRFTYHTWASAAYARLDTFRTPLNELPPPVALSSRFPPPEPEVNTGRVDWMQKLSAPFDLGPFRVVPYGVLDLAYYTHDNNGEQQGRIYGGGGVRASVPLSHLYRDVCSELFNVQGLYHKNLFSVNYFIAGSSVSALVLPQLDRLNDDAVEDGWRDVIPWEPTFPQTRNANGVALTAGSYDRFNPRLYAIRRLVDSRPDTLDDIHAVQLDWRQRWQTKRGYPGLEHIVDWLTFDVSATVFPAADRDNFGSQVGLIEYLMVWNVGDRNSVYSSGWCDPFEFGARYWELGTTFQRDDRTRFNVAYRQTDPLASKVVSASATYVFSPKYAMALVTAYDFGYQSSFSNSLYFTRVGPDAQVTVGFTYNSLINNFGVTLNVVPNLMASQTSPVPVRGAGSLSGNQYQGR
ncbi:MAG TPA: hypothetical protein VKD90_28570, partial [Gemmataceae bacterium]|nr:hypothetical protein [Gemmataceae bacterium]